MLAATGVEAGRARKRPVFYTRFGQNLPAFLHNTVSPPAPARITLKEHNLPLGHDTDYPDKYAPEVLRPIPRSESRHALGIAGDLPFRGVDIWNAWELTWLGPGGRPEVATAEIVVPADSPNIIESKSLKLYLNSFAMTSVESDIEDTIRKDLSGCAGDDVAVRVLPLARNEFRRVSRLAGDCIDTLDVRCSDSEVDPGLLHANTFQVASEDLYTHLLRSLCPVTAQPDTGSLQISYRGPKIDRAGLLRYIVSYRQHSDFHESCVERIFVDLMERCNPEALTVYARYQRRGGIDINPCRSTSTGRPLNLRLWRQ